MIVILGLVVVAFSTNILSFNRELESLDLEIKESQINPEDVKKIVTQEATTRDEIVEEFVQQHVNDRIGLANPRIKIRNASGTEVIGLDHNGTISSINLAVDFNGTFGDSVIAEYFCNSTGSCWSDLSGSGGGSGKSGAGPWLSNDTNTIIFNDTLGNLTYGQAIFWNKTASTYNGNFSAYVGTGKTGYEAGNEICSTNFTGTHLCDWNEMKRTYDLKDVSAIVAWTGTSWMAGGPSKFVPADYQVNDCHGFTDASGTDSKGNAWSFSSNKGLTGECNSLIPLACCKPW